MIVFINKIMGNLMYVDDLRKDEYLAAGHKLAASPCTKKTTAEKPTQKRTVKNERLRNG